MVKELQQAFLAFDEDPTRRVAVLTGAGNDAFSAGADINEWPELWRAIPTVGFETDKPIIAAVSGWCVGGALVMAMMLGREGNDWLKAYAAAYAKSQADADTSWQKHLAARAANSTPSLPLAKYAGTYRDPWYGDVILRQGGKGLEMQFSKTAELLGDIEHWQHDSFIVRWRDRSLNADAFVNFSLDADGNIREMRMEPVSPLTDFSFDFQDLRLVPVAVEKK